MANEIKDKFSASNAFTCTLASLANGSGRQSTFVDNETTRYQDLLVFMAIESAAGATASSVVEIYALRGDAHTENIHSDGAGDTDAALTPLNAQLLGVLRLNSSGGAQTVKGEFLFHRPGPSFAIAVKNATGAALGSTEANHIKRWVGLNPEVQ